MTFLKPDPTIAHERELARQLGMQGKLDAHLTRSINELSGKETPMRGLQRLSNLTVSIVKQTDDQADAVADRLVVAKSRHEATLAKFTEFTASYEQAASEAEAALAQLTNLPPPD